MIYPLPVIEIERPERYLRVGTKPWLRDQLQRQNPCCRFCGRRIGRKRATLDHLIPRGRGGSNDAANLTLACRSCNRLKANLTPREFALHLLAMALRSLALAAVVGELPATEMEGGAA